MLELVDVAIPPLARAYTYSLPREARTVEIGFHVEVPLGNRVAPGFVIAKKEQLQADQDRALKPIHTGALLQPAFLPSQLKFFNWVADYYVEALSVVIDTAIPARVAPLTSSYVTLVQEPERPLRGKLQNNMIQLLRDAGGPLELAEISRSFRAAKPTLLKLAQKGYLKIETSAVKNRSEQHELANWAKRSISLNASQQAAFDKLLLPLQNRSFSPFLLHGITGSGKTEVYIEALKAARTAGLGALVIVPEIALTPQLVERFIARLGNDVALLHSALSKRNRWNNWQALLDGRAAIALGTRSAVFAPVQNLGLIIVDEEHDSSFKQSDSFRYHARDLAVVRGQLSSCPVVLGSATPSLETLHNALRKKYQYLSLPLRPLEGAGLAFSLVDLNRKKPPDLASKNISQELYGALKEVLARGEQAFILYNRRGFASYLQCDRCTNVLQCPNCSVTFTYHRSRNSLCCHYCYHQLIVPLGCPLCSHAGNSEPGKLIERGSGTERIFEELEQLLPGVSLGRLDRDSVERVEEYRRILDAVREGKIQVLVGTQMIAKGHDLPNVTLVGVVDCDVGLNFPDFRSSERVFQLLTQAAGRAGRASHSGLVILQTRLPEHPSIIFTLKQDYLAFSRNELEQRRSLRYPPFSRVARVVVSAPQSYLAEQLIQHLKTGLLHFISKHGLAAALLGPSPAPLTKLRSQWRWQLLCKSEHSSVIRKLVAYGKTVARSNVDRSVRVVFDIDPQDML